RYGYTRPSMEPAPRRRVERSVLEMPMSATRSILRVVLTLFAAATLVMAIVISPPAQSAAPQAGGGQAPARRAAGGGRQGTQPGGGRAMSPAAQRPPETTTPQSYPEEQVSAGRGLFAANCGFCHGRDAMGGETGPDLTRSELVATDVRGDKITPVIRNGRPEKKMPPFTLSETDLGALVAFIHDAKEKAGTLEGSRRSVEAGDLQTGNPQAGQAYFNGAGACTTCHSATGDLAGVATRYQGLALFQRLLNPPGRGGRGGRTPRQPQVTVTLPGGQSLTGNLAYQDEFTIAL